VSASTSDHVLELFGTQNRHNVGWYGFISKRPFLHRRHSRPGKSGENRIPLT
jgi:hypothetical protein